jgi:hypothetical protein
MKSVNTHEKFPIRVVMLSNLMSFIIYGLGLWIISQTGLMFAILYGVFVGWFEYRLLSQHCVNCYYWGKTCGFGKGRLSAWLFKKGNISTFACKPMSWRDMIPDLLISFIPTVIAIVLLIYQFDLLLLSALLMLLVLTTFGNGFIRGSLTCKYCKQRELGCPAEQLFNKGHQN